MKTLTHLKDGSHSGIMKTKAKGLKNKGLGVFIWLILAYNLSAFSQNYTVFRSDSNGKYGVKNDKGEAVIPERYASILLLSDGNFVVYEENPGWPMIINQKSEVLVSKTNYIGKVLEGYNNHFICQYYKDGKMADLVLFKAPDIVLYTFPLKYIHAEFVKDNCYTYVSAQTETPGEKLSIAIDGKALTGPENIDFDYIKTFFKPCNGYGVVLKNKGNEGILSGVYDIDNRKMIIPCNFSDIEFDEKNSLIKAYHKVQTMTYNLYNMNGELVKTWDQIKK